MNRYVKKSNKKIPKVYQNQYYVKKRRHEEKKEVKGNKEDLIRGIRREERERKGEESVRE